MEDKERIEAWKKYAGKFPITHGAWTLTDIADAFNAGYEAHEKEIGRFRCPICHRLNCTNDHGY